MTLGRLVLCITQAANREYTPAQSRISKIHCTSIDNLRECAKPKNILVRLNFKYVYVQF